MPYRDPTAEELKSPLFEAIWQEIKSWDIRIPALHGGYMGATGNHVCAIIDAVAASSPTAAVAANESTPQGLLDIPVSETGALHQPTLWFVQEKAQLGWAGFRMWLRDAIADAQPPASTAPGQSLLDDFLAGQRQLTPAEQKSLRSMYAKLYKPVQPVAGEPGAALREGLNQAANIVEDMGDGYRYQDVAQAIREYAAQSQIAARVGEPGLWALREQVLTAIDDLTPEDAETSHPAAKAYQVVGKIFEAALSATAPREPVDTASAAQLVRDWEDLFSQETTDLPLECRQDLVRRIAAALGPREKELREATATAWTPVQWDEQADGTILWRKHVVRKATRSWMLEPIKPTVCILAAGPAVAPAEEKT
jgi:hypothetical protein